MQSSDVTSSMAGLEGTVDASGLFALHLKAIIFPNRWG